MKRGLYSRYLTPEEIIEINNLAGPILVLGASGFIGANIFFTLSQHRDDVFGCSRNITSNWRYKEYYAWRRLIDADITKFNKLNDLIKDIKPRTVFNLSSYGGHSHQTDIEKIHRVNYLGTLNIIKSLPGLKSVLVQAGSSSEYGLNNKAPRENDQLEPNSDYGVSKIGASYLIRYYGKIMHPPAMHLRLYSIYGPWQERRTLMPVLISNCLENKWPNLVHRDTSHDFVYVDDCVNAFIKSALSLHQGKNTGESVNIATGVKTTIGDLVNTVKKIINVTAEPEYGSMSDRIQDSQNWYGNPELANKILNWHSRTSLEEGIRLLIDWEKKFKKTA